VGNRTGPPLLWFEPDHNVAVSTNPDAGTLRIHLQVSPFERQLQVAGLGIAFFVFSLVPSLVLLDLWHSDSSSTDDATRWTGCAGIGMNTRLLGDGAVYCVDPMFPDQFPSDAWMVGDEQHLATDGNDDGYEVEYRWATVEDLVVYGEVLDGTYNCYTFLPETNLPTDWNVTHLSPPSLDAPLPDWCGQPVSENERNYSVGTHPYEGVWMYDVGEGADAPRVITSHKEDDGAYWFQQWEWEQEVMLQSYVEGSDDGPPLIFGCCLFATVTIGVLVLVGAYSNPRLGIEVNHEQRTVVRQQFGRLPSVIRKTLHGVDVESLTLRPNLRFVHHSDEHGSSTTEHPGVDLIVNTEQGVHALAFVENDDTGERHELIAKLSSAVRGQVVDVNLVEGGTPASVDTGSENTELGPVGPPNMLDDEQQVIEHPAPVMVFEASSVVQVKEAAEDGTHRPEGSGLEPTDTAPSVQDGGFWNFDGENVED